MRRRVGAALLATALVGGSAAAQGYGPPISLAQARSVAAATEAEAVRGRDRVVIAVVDPGGALVLLHRMDGAIHAADALAPAKARSAAAFRQPTLNFQQAASAPGGAFMVGVAGAVPVEGGVPILHQGRVIGAVGVSGSAPEDDGRIARAGAAVLVAAG